LALSTGDRVGPYEVVAPLGAGGMGEVFRARDARLKRDVALKVLPAAAVGDADRRLRFEREAQVLASLNHPSIANIFGVELAGDVPVIVMELIEGPTLADRLTRGPTPIGEALAIATQICDGLEAAHERNVIHRDLKPANIKVRDDGTIKILDFGLARVLNDDADVDSSNSPTALVGRTELGIVLGTAAYMSPEQARGRAVDKRADIWAFGCVLFEMLAGTPTFSGESTTDILAEVVQREPDWSRLPATVPGRITELLHRCLQKHAKDRLRDIADARFEIDAALRPAHRSGTSVGMPAPVPASRSRSTGPTLMWLAIGVVAGAGLAVAWLALRPRSSAPEPSTRLVVSLPPDATVALTRGSAVALSPDGRQLVYAGRVKDKVQLYARSLDRFESRVLDGTDGAADPFFSSDGRWVGFFADGKLKKLAMEGGAPVTVADARTPRGEAWGPNDEIFVTPMNNAGVSRVLPSGKLEPVTTLRPGQLSHRWPRVLPDGSAILFTIWNDVGWEPARIAAQRLDGGEPKIVVESGGGFGRYVRDPETGRAYLVYARSEGLLAGVFDASRLALTSQAIPVVDAVVTNLSGGAHFDLSASGTLAYVPGTIGEADRQLVWTSLDGRSEPAISVRGMSRVWMLSPDGTRVVRNNTVGPNRDVWIEDVVRRTSTRLTNSADNFIPIWSADGKWVAFSRGAPISEIYRRPADGSGVEERLVAGPNDRGPSSFSPDGTALAYTEFDPASGSDIWILPLPLSSSAPARAFVKTNFSEGNAVFSPDGRWLAYQSNESGRFEVYVRSLPDGGQTVRVSTDGGLVPAWSPTGRELFYRSTNGKMMAASVDAEGGLHAGKPRVLFDAIQYENQYGVAPDGKRFLMMPLIPTEQSPTQIHLVLNFLSELRQRVR
jgi:eukaryotic-like serine/threonine-protein kinase